MSFDFAPLGELLAEKGYIRGPFGSALKRSELKSVGTPVYEQQQAIDGHRKFRFFVDATKHEELKRFTVRANDLIVSCSGTVGRVSVIKQEDPVGIISQALLILRPDIKKLTPQFLYYFLLSPFGQRELLNASHGAVQLNIAPRAVVEKIPTPVPRIEEQNKIVSILATLDDRITLLRETSAILEGIAQALFKSWFVDFDPVRAKMEGRAPEGMDEATAALFPGSFEESELGLVPREWKISALDGISDVGIGKTPPRKEAHWFSENPDDIRWVSIRDMGSSGAFLFETSEYLTAEAVDRFNVRRVPDGTVLISFKLTIGRVSITNGEMTTNEAIAHCKLTEQSPLPSEYIYLYLKQFDYSSLGSTSSIAEAVNSKMIKAIPILVPNAAVVAAFTDKIQAVFKRIKENQAQAQTLATMRDTLLPSLVSGKIQLLEAVDHKGFIET